MFSAQSFFSVFLKLWDREADGVWGEELWRLMHSFVTYVSLNSFRIRLHSHSERLPEFCNYLAKEFFPVSIPSRLFYLWRSEVTFCCFLSRGSSCFGRVFWPFGIFLGEHLSNLSTMSWKASFSLTFMTSNSAASWIASDRVFLAETEILFLFLLTVKASFTLYNGWLSLDEQEFSETSQYYHVPIQK